MEIRRNPNTGEIFGLQGNEWVKLQVMRNPQTDETFYLNGNEWQAVPSMERTAKLRGRDALNVLGGLASPLVMSAENSANKLVQRTAGVSALVDYLFGTNTLEDVADMAINKKALPANVGDSLADTLGFPKPLKGAENVTSKAVRGVGDAATFLLGGGLLKAAGTAPKLANWLTSAPKMQLVSGATGGAALGASQNRGDSDLGQLIATVLGGSLPAAPTIAKEVSKYGAKKLAGGIGGLTKTGKQYKADKIFQDAAYDSNASREALEHALQNNKGELVKGDFPTAAQITQDAGIAELEKALRNKGGTGIGSRYSEQEAARQAHLNELLNPITQRNTSALDAVRQELVDFAPYGGAVEKQAGGGTVRADFLSAKKDSKQATKAIYDAIDPEKTTSLDADAVRQRFQSVLDDGGRYQDVPADVGGVMRQLGQDVESGAHFGYNDLQEIRTKLGNIASMAAKSGDDKTGRLVTILKGQLDEYLDTTPSFSPEQRGLLNAGKQSRIQQRKLFEEGANRKLGLAGNEHGGHKMADSAVLPTYFNKQSGEPMQGLTRALGANYANTETASVMRDYAIQQALAQSTDKATGFINPTKLQGFLDSFAPALGNMGDTELASALRNALTKQKGNVTAQQGLENVAGFNNTSKNWTLANKDRVFPALEQGAQFTAGEGQALGLAQQAEKRAKDALHLSRTEGSPTAQILNLQSDMGLPPIGTFTGGVAGMVVDGALQGAVNQSKDDVINALAKSILDPEYAFNAMNNAGKGFGGKLTKFASTPNDNAIRERLKHYGIGIGLGIESRAFDIGEQAQ